jgi:hypothetical protein
MENYNLTVTLVVDKRPEIVFEAINNVPAWWSEEFKGASARVGDEFEVRFADVHYSKHRVVELVPGKKVVWDTLDSRLSFLQDKAEWTGTKIVFDIVSLGTQTKIVFTHEGIVPACECFKDCSNGWKYYLEGSLAQWVDLGKGNPNVLEAEIEKKRK